MLEFKSSSASDVSHRYLWGQAVDQLLADEQLTSTGSAGNVLWPLTDNLGTIRDIADLSGGTTSVTNHRRFNAYGDLVSEFNAAVDMVFAFTGKLYDENVKLQNNLNRWYDASTGQWISQDPLGFGGNDTNLRRYVAGNAINKIDPSGLRQNQVFMAPGIPAPLSLAVDPDVFALMASMNTIGRATVDWDTLDYVANGAAGFGDEISFGVTDHIREYFGFNEGIDHDSWVYFNGNMAGVAVGTGIGLGAGNAANATVWSVKAANVYVIAGDAYGVAESSYHLYTGEFSISDAASFAPMAGWVGGRILRNADDLAGLAPHLKNDADEEAFNIFFDNKKKMFEAPDQGVPAVDPSRPRFATPDRLAGTPIHINPSDYIPPDPRFNGGPPPLFSDN